MHGRRRGYTIHDIVAAQVMIHWFHGTDCACVFRDTYGIYSTHSILYSHATCPTCISRSIVFFAEKVALQFFCVFYGVQVARASLILKSLANMP